MDELKIPADIAEMSFEDALAELENLIGKMENGGMPLDALAKNFERGKLLTAHCKAQLDNLERKITVLTKDDGNNGEWSDFDAAANRRNAEDVPF